MCDGYPYLVRSTYVLATSFTALSDFNQQIYNITLARHFKVGAPERRFLAWFAPKTCGSGAEEQLFCVGARGSGPEK